MFSDFARWPWQWCSMTCICLVPMVHVLCAPCGDYIFMDILVNNDNSLIPAMVILNSTECKITKPRFFLSFRKFSIYLIDLSKGLRLVLFHLTEIQPEYSACLNHDIWFFDYLLVIMRMFLKIEPLRTRVLWWIISYRIFWSVACCRDVSIE